jgi:hypothetical protein
VTWLYVDSDKTLPFGRVLPQLLLAV